MRKQVLEYLEEMENIMLWSWVRNAAAENQDNYQDMKFVENKMQYATVGSLEVPCYSHYRVFRLECLNVILNIWLFSFDVREKLEMMHRECHADQVYISQHPCSCSTPWPQHEPRIVLGLENYISKLLLIIILMTKLKKLLNSCRGTGVHIKISSVNKWGRNSGQVGSVYLLLKWRSFL